MTTLVIETVKGELNQVINYKLDTRACVAGFYPYLYMHKSSDALFRFKLLRGEQVLFQHIFTCPMIKSAIGTSSDYAHVFYPCIPQQPLFLEKGSYTLRLTSSTPSDPSSFLAWVRQHEDLNNTIESVVEGNVNPLSHRIKIFKAAHLCE